jgi:hypothetical protein
MESRREGEKTPDMNLIRAAAWPQDTFRSAWASSRTADEPASGHADQTAARDARMPVPVIPADPALTYGCVDWYLYPGGAPQAEDARNH